jgi:hypothetical protein
MLDKIALLSHHSALAVLDQAGMELRDRTREAFASSKKSNWHVKVVNGKRVWYKGDMRPVFGQRFNFKRKGADNMSSMITSFLMARDMTVVVAGMHKRHIPRMYYQEAKSGGESMMYGKPVGQVLHGSWQILKKLSEGGRFKNLDPKYKATRMGEDTKPIGVNPYYRPRTFIERGRAMAMPKVQEIMTSKLESLIYKQVNRATVKTTVRAA